MDSKFLSELLGYVASVALSLASLGTICTCVQYGITSRVPYGEMKALGGLFLISASLFSFSEAFGVAGASAAVVLRPVPDPLAQYIHAFWGCANFAVCVALMKIIDAFEHPERGWGRGWQHVARAGDVLREYAAGKTAAREEKQTRARWHECARGGADRD